MKIENRDELKELVKEVVKEVLEERKEEMEKGLVFAGSLEQLNEGTVVNTNKYKIGIFPDSGDRLITNPYFKFAPANQSGYNRCARISIFRNEYIPHKGSINLIMSSKVINDLNEILDNYWDSIIEEIIRVSPNAKPELIERVRNAKQINYSGIIFNDPSGKCRKENWR